LNQLSRLWESGIELNWANIQRDKDKQKIALPTYSFEPIEFPMAQGLYEMLGGLLANKTYQKKDNIADWFYELTWKKARLLPTPVKSKPNENYLLFVNENQLEETIIDQLQKDKKTIVKVIQGAQFEQKNSLEFVLNPGNEEDYQALFNTLKSTNLLPDEIIHLWNYTIEAEKLTYDSTSKNLEIGYYSLLNCAKAIGEISPFHPIGIKVVTSFASNVNVDDECMPLRTSILGPVLTISKEYPNLRCRQIDLDPVHEPMVSTNLLDEIYSEDETPMIAYRNGNRWSQFYDQVKLEPNDQLPVRIKTNGTYLITGGVGGMGQVFSEYLSKKYKAKLILTGRKPESEVKDQLEKIGNDVIYLNVNIEDASQMKEQLTKAESQFGKINGIIHTAGIGDYAGIIQNRPQLASEQVFASKIYGTIVLNYLASSRNLDFIVLCSSAASVAAPFGEVAYTTANMFQDSFARANNKHIQSIGWHTWSETGMALEALQNKSEEEKMMHIANGITNEEGVEILIRSLGYGIPSLTTFTSDLELLLKDTELEPIFKEKAQYVQSRPVLANVYIAPETDMEKTICELFEQYFGIEEIGIKDDFFDLGLDSLKAMTLVGLIHQKLNIELKINDVLENANICELSKKVETIRKVNQMQDGRKASTFKNKIEL
jgi:NADP-dependent 3-hydroxy acid dehydrogenase YdfG/acyl carrier protein